MHSDSNSNYPKRSLQTHPVRLVSNVQRKCSCRYWSLGSGWTYIAGYTPGVYSSAFTPLKHSMVSCNNPRLAHKLFTTSSWGKRWKKFHGYMKSGNSMVEGSSIFSYNVQLLLLAECGACTFWQTFIAGADDYYSKIVHFNLLMLPLL